MGGTRPPKQKVTHAKLRVKKKVPTEGDAEDQHQVIHNLVLQGGLGNVDLLVKAPMVTTKTTNFS